MPTHHDIPVTHDHMVWGTLDAAQPPVLRVASGDTVTLRVLPGRRQGEPAARPARVPPAYRAALDGLVQEGRIS